MAPALLEPEQSDAFQSLSLRDEKQQEPKVMPHSVGDLVPKCTTRSISERAQAAMVVLNRYRIAYQNDWELPESIVRSQALLEDFLSHGEPIELIIPGFPFKSSNRSKKVLGSLPDEAERISLQHLNGLCEAVKEVTESSCHLVIISDGISYNDTTADGHDLGCHNIRFARMHQLLGEEYRPDGDLSEEKYLEMVPRYREGLEAHTPEGYDVLEDIANNPDTEKTYCGYKKFLQTERDVKLSRSRMEKENAAIAKRMLRRGKAFAEAILKTFPKSIRLSIHPSTDTNKISILMLPQDNAASMTPWHGAVVRSLNGTITMTHAHNVSAISHELVFENGQPMYFRERSDLFLWNGKVLRFTYLYPTGMVVRPVKATSKYALCTVDMQKVRALAEHCSPVILRGFSQTMDRRAFIAKAYDLGDVLRSPSGIVQKIQDLGTTHTQNGNGTAGAIPMDLDDMRSLSAFQDQDFSDSGDEQDTHRPRFQYTVAQQATAYPGDGYSLFSSSARFFQALPKFYNIDKLQKVRWSYRSGCMDLSRSLPLIAEHPTQGAPCVQWLQPRGTSAGHNDPEISIENGFQGLSSLIDSVLLDPRVCLYFEWERGDVVVSDNFSTLHAHTASKGGCRRELWRILTL